MNAVFGVIVSLFMLTQSGASPLLPEGEKPITNTDFTAQTAEQSGNNLSAEDTAFLGKITYEDYIISGGVVYVNVEESVGKDWIPEAVVRDYKSGLTKSGLLGTVVNTASAADLNGVASKLPTGTKIYRFYPSRQLIIAETDNKLVLYVIDDGEIGWFAYDSMISENTADYVFFDGIAYGNISNEPQWTELNLEYVREDYFGTVFFNKNERDRYKLVNGTANLLPVGTKFYDSNQNGIILADTKDGLIPYLALLEG
jgi:hypothetical protein